MGEVFIRVRLSWRVRTSRYRDNTTAFAERVRELADAEVMAMVEPFLAILSVMLKEFARLTKQVLHIVRKEEVCRRLISAPGVGPITALAFRATVDRPERFGSSRAVGAHLEG